MAIYTTLFGATLTELEERFPNVGDPLPGPRGVTRTNPFTKQLVEVALLEPEFGPPRHTRSLYEKDTAPLLTPFSVQDDDYGRYLYGLVPARLRSVPHIGTKNVSFDEAEELMGLPSSPPEKYVACLDGEGVVQVASAGLAETLRECNADELRERFPEAWQGLPLEWLQGLLLVPAPTKRYLCAWLRI